MYRQLTTCRALISAMTLGLGTAHAAEVVIEPDNYLGNVSNVAPGATLSAFRRSAAGSYQFTPALSIPGGSWSPTGNRVFGHSLIGTSDRAELWDNLNGAYECEQSGFCFDDFRAFRVDFDVPTTNVGVLTTFHGWESPDPMELAAFNSDGERLLRCWVMGVHNGVLQSGVLPAPRYLDASGEATGPVCGTVIVKKNCGTFGPGAHNCDYVVSLKVIRRQSDIAYVMVAGPLFSNTFAAVDKLTYNYIPLGH